MPLVARQRSSKVAQPGDRSFDLSATLLPPQLAAILSRQALPSSPVRAHKIEAASLQPLTMRVAVIGSIGDQRDLAADHRHFRDEVFDQRDLCRRSTRGPACHRNGVFAQRRKKVQSRIDGCRMAYKPQLLGNKNDAATRRKAQHFWIMESTFRASGCFRNSKRPWGLMCCQATGQIFLVASAPCASPVLSWCSRRRERIDPL